MTTALGVPSQPSSSVNDSHVGQSKPAASVATSTFDDGLSAFLSVRPRLFGIAYRMLGSAAEAEDIVQDVWVRWQTANRRLVRDAAAFLAKTATRLGCCRVLEKVTRGVGTSSAGSSSERPLWYYILREADVRQAGDRL